MQTAESALRKGDELCNDGQFAEAIVFYNDAIQIDPSDKRAYYSKGGALDDLS